MCSTYVELYTEEQVWDTNLDQDDKSSVDLKTNFKRGNELPHG
jgi:hypothetical protein